ncbi:STAG domain [Rhizoctonia solani]|uniref:STAG domain n=1 Tax=Rhizoctonia solani TaxID=456999 RepID=A0A8H7I948_9AGAM|nr:STAG domain [Rhizoctonia solani]
MSSDGETTPKAPRRSTRDRKTVKPYVSIPQPTRKRKRTKADNGSDTEGTDGERSAASEPENDSDDEGLEPQDKDKDEAEESESEDDDEGEEYKAPRASQAKATIAPKPRGRPKGTTDSAKHTRKKPAATKPRATKARKGEGGGHVTSDLAINKDNALCTVESSSALQSVVDDYFESYNQAPSAALADLANCILRACGCNASLDSDEVLDSDNVVDKLDDLIEAVKKEAAPAYPLVSKHPGYKKFRKQLSELLHRLIQSAADLPQPSPLFPASDDTGLLPVLQPWIVCMSTSLVRSFRHTGTIVALEMESALCEVAKDVEKEGEVLGRQREAERKRRASVPGKSKGKTPREKELDSKAENVKRRKTVLNDYLKEFFDDVFVHRYRDADAGIRADCVRELGKWMKTHPTYFLSGTYLRYIGWLLSDMNTSVRLEAIKALSALYTSSDNSTVLALTNFTERFKPRLLQMAAQDSDVGVRVAVARVLTDIDTQGLLEEDEQAPLCLLVFDVEARVRKAVAGFVRGVWEASVEEKLQGRNSKGKEHEKEKQRAGVKCLLSSLVEWIKLADASSSAPNETQEDPDSSQQQPATQQTSGAVVSLLLNPTGTKSRIALAVSALWDELDILREWNALLDHVLLDHSGGSGGEIVSSPSKRRAAKGPEPGEDPAWRLSEAEESVAMEVLIAALGCIKEEALQGKKGEDESVTADITRALMKALPRLFAKVQTDEKRVGDVLLLPQYMNLDMYVELRETPAYEQLWNDVTKQFFSHSTPTVLRHVVSVIQQFTQTTSLANTNALKILELEDELATSVRQLLAGREELDIVTFTEDEVHALSAFVLRLHTLYGVRDMTAWMEEDDTGKVSRLVDVLGALSERGRLGYKEEEMMMNESLQLLVLYVAWKARLLQTSPMAEDDRTKAYEELKEIRDALTERLVQFSVGTQTNTIEGVKRIAFQCLLNLAILFQPHRSIEEDTASKQPTPMTLPDELQLRCKDYIQTEIEQYIDLLDEEREDSDEQASNDGDSSSLSEDEDTKARKPKKSKNGKRPERGGSPSSKTLPQARLEREYTFHLVISAFFACDPNGGHEYRTFCSKALSGALVIRGAQLSVLRRLDTVQVANVHITCISWIVKKISGYQTMGNKNARNRSVAFFKSLVWLLSTVESSDAIRIKNHLDVTLTDANVETPASSKVWEPLRAYDKRLITAMAKDKALAARIKTRKSTAAVATDDEHEADEGEGHQTDVEPDQGQPSDEEDHQPAAREEPESKRTRTRPRPRAKPKSTTPTEEAPDDIDIPDAPKSIPSQKQRQRGEETEAEGEPHTGKQTSATSRTTRANSRKRVREPQEEEEEDEEEQVAEDQVEAAVEVEHEPSSKPPSQATSDVGFTRRRKRAKA